MAEQSLTINFSPAAPSPIDPYWLRMEIVESDDGQMTVGEAADFIDSLYNTSICGAKDPDPEPAEKPDGTDWDRALALLKLPMCDNLQAVLDGDAGAYDVQVRVYRSHITELYKMVLSNGTLGSPRRTEEHVVQFLDLEDTSYVTLDQPIHKNPRVTWQDIDGPDIHITGNTLWWDGEVTGVLRAEFDTIFDLIDVHVTGIKNTNSEMITGTDGWFGTGWYSGNEDGSELFDVQDTECTAIAFYHYMYEELQLHKPELDESVSEDQAVALCRYAGSTHVPGSPGFGDEPWSAEACKAACDDMFTGEALAKCYEQCSRICFKRYKYDTICICGGKKGTEFVDVPVLCPPGHNTGSLINGGAITYGSYAYIDCGIDEVRDREYYKEICCEYPDEKMILPDCKRKYGPFMGDNMADEDELKEKYGENVRIIPVGPLEKRCGDHVTVQDINAKNCCDLAPQIYWDYDNSAEVVSNNSSAEVAVTGGLLPLTVSVRGNGFWLDGGYKIRDASFTLRRFRIFTDDDACGACRISVTDGCTTVNGVLLCTVGVWEALPEEEWPSPKNFTNYDSITYDGGNPIYPRLYKREGNYKYEQKMEKLGCSTSTGYSSSSHDDACVNVPKTLGEVQSEAAADQAAYDEGDYYFSPNVFEAIFSSGSTGAYCYNQNAPAWEYCGSGQICLDGFQFSSSSSPHYRCQNAASPLVATKSINIYEWVCP